MINLATVGTSAITEKFLAACRLTGKYRLYEAFSRDECRAAKFAVDNGFEKHCSSLEEMANDSEIDAVYIATPNSLHFSQSKLFLENGKHVICEKPLVTDSRQYETLSALAKSRGLVFAEAIMSRHSAGRPFLLEALGKIGKISHVRIDYCQRSSRYDSFLKGEQVNIFDMSLNAGTLMDLGIYCVYAAVDLLGFPKSVTAAASFLENGADSSGTAIFIYDGFSAAITYSKTGNTAVGSEIIGDAGTIKIGSVSQYADISLVKNGSETLLFGMPERPEAMRGEAEKFAGYIENGGDFAEDRAQSEALTAGVHKCMDLIKKSAGIKYPTKGECI